MSAWGDPRIVRGMTAQLALRRERIAAGARPIGWKVGFGTPVAMQKFGIDAPLVGFLLDRGRIEPGAVVSFAGWTKPVLEPEIAVHIGRDLSGGVDRAGAAGAIAGLGPAIELADLDPPPEDVEAILAGNIFHRHVILGPRDTGRAGGRIAGLNGRVIRNGNEIAATSELEANTGELIGIVHHVANLLAAFGERLQAGEVIIAGSVVPPLFVEPADDGAAFALDPVGTVSVRFDRAD
jgi:2-keto-4-pentenoate hydratase